MLLSCPRLLRLPIYRCTTKRSMQIFVGEQNFKPEEAPESEVKSHIPVMAALVTKLLSPKANQVFLDMTFGDGGHTKHLLNAEPSLKMIALDRDPLAHGRAQELATIISNILPVQGKFSEVHHLIESHGFGPGSIDGIIIDAGVSSMQFDEASRGFSLSKEGPLDMRMDPTNLTICAADVVNFSDESSLYKIFKYYGEEKQARYIAQAIIDYRNSFGHISTTEQLKSIVEMVYQGSHRKDKLMRHAHSATKTFQSLRIFVNDELNELHNALNIAHYLLKPGACCVAISFHSLEDRIVKRHFHNIDVDAKLSSSLTDKMRNQQRYLLSDRDAQSFLHQKWHSLEHKPFLPTQEEITNNPRSRSAKLRAAVKLSS